MKEVGFCNSYVLVLSGDKKINFILEMVLQEKNLNYKISNEIDDLTTDYCLIILGPDIEYIEFFRKLKTLCGIPPYVLILEKEKSCHYHSYISCKCKKVELPMGILQIQKYIDEVLYTPYS